MAMATYNGEKFLAEQLDSLLHQTYKNIEIVITDDGSKDNTIAIIKKYQQSADNIHLYINDINTGVTKAFERSVRMSAGEFICFADQDDIWVDNKIEILLNNIEKEDAVYSNSELVDQHGISLNKDFSSIMNMRSYYSGEPFFVSNCVPGHTILMKKSFAEKILPFPENIMFDRWISYCAAANNGIRYVDKILVKYRQHENNTIGTGRKKHARYKEIKSRLFQDKLEELQTIQTAPVSNNETQYILKEMLLHFHRGWSIQRSLFFFRNIDKILVIKKRSRFRKILYCLKMIFKANY